MAANARRPETERTARSSEAAVGLPPERDVEHKPISVAQSSFLIFGSSVVGAGGFFVSSLVLARSLGPSGRGTVAFVTVTALLTARIVKLGLGQATVVLAARRPEARAALLANLLSFSLAASLGGIVLVVGGLELLDVAPAGFAPHHLPILAAAIAAASLVDDNFLIGSGRLRAAAAISASGGWMCAAAIGTALLFGGIDVETAMLAWVTAHLIWAGLLAGVGLRIAGAGLPSLPLLVESIRFGARAWGGSVAQFLNARADQLLVGVIATDATLGLYVVAVNAAEILLFLPNALATALLPVLAREHVTDATQRTLRMFRSASVLTVACTAVTGALGWLLIPVAFGEAFEGAVEPFLWLLPGALGYAALSIFVGALLAAQSPGLTTASRAVSLSAGLMLDVALIPVLGATGAAVAASTAFLAGGATAAAFYRRTSGFAWRELLPGRRDVTFLRLVAARALPRMEAST